MVIMYLVTLVPPIIDKGSFVPRPYFITRGNKGVKIGTPVYVQGGFNVKIDCNTVNGSRPITNRWFHNGSPYRTGQSVSTITITNPTDGDVFECIAENIIGFDNESTTIYVQHCKFVCHNYI